MNKKEKMTKIKSSAMYEALLRRIDTLVNTVVEGDGSDEEYELEILSDLVIEYEERIYGSAL